MRALEVSVNGGEGGGATTSEKRKNAIKDADGGTIVCATESGLFGDASRASVSRG